MTNPAACTLAQRLGITAHVSPLRFTLERIRSAFPSRRAASLEAWLLEVANARGARVVVPANGGDAAFAPPPEAVLPTEDLVVGLCQPQGRDHPQILRLAAQLISRGTLDLRVLRLAARRERVEPILAELARLALRVDPRHAAWRQILDWFGSAPPLHEPLLHWTRLATPIMKAGQCNAAGWRLVA
jgi:hypothetical protein